MNKMKLLRSTENEYRSPKGPEEKDRVQTERKITRVRFLFRSSGGEKTRARQGSDLLRGRKGGKAKVEIYDSSPAAQVFPK